MAKRIFLVLDYCSHFQFHCTISLQSLYAKALHANNLSTMLNAYKQNILVGSENSCYSCSEAYLDIEVFLFCFSSLDNLISAHIMLNQNSL